MVTAVTYRAEDWDIAGDVLDLSNFNGLLVDALQPTNTRTGTVVFTPKDVPEPATGLLVAAGLLGLALRRRLA